jgi:hypothetical protein
MCPHLLEDWCILATDKGGGRGGDRIPGACTPSIMIHLLLWCYPWQCVRPRAWSGYMSTLWFTFNLSDAVSLSACTSDFWLSRGALELPIICFPYHFSPFPSNSNLFQAELLAWVTALSERAAGRQIWHLLTFIFLLPHVNLQTNFVCKNMKDPNTALTVLAACFRSTCGKKGRCSPPKIVMIAERLCLFWKNVFPKSSWLTTLL